MTGENRTYINTLDISWGDFEYHVAELVKQIKKSKKKISNIYGIPRGGLVLAVRLSHLLKKPLILSWEDHNDDTLIVDDVADTGETLLGHMPYCMGLIEVDCGNLWNTATLLYCPNSKFKPTFFAGIKSKTTWIVFPWEVNHKV